MVGLVKHRVKSNPIHVLVYSLVREGYLEPRALYVDNQIIFQSRNRVSHAVGGDVVCFIFLSWTVKCASPVSGMALPSHH